MDDKSRKDMNEYYSGLLNKHGISPEAQGRGFRSQKQMNGKYAILSAIEPIPQYASILDVGGGRIPL